MKIDLDTRNYTLDELDEIYAIAGAGLGAIIRRLTEMRGSDLKALAVVNERRRNPRFTLEMAGRLDFGDVEFVVPEDDDHDANPTEANVSNFGQTA